MALTFEDLGLLLDREIDAGQQLRAERILALAYTAVANAHGVSTADFKSDPPENGEAVVLSVAARAFENPLVLASESAGPWSGSYRAGGFELTNYERRELGVAGARGVFDVGLGSPDRYNVPVLAVDPADWPEWILNGPNGP